MTIIQYRSLLDLVAQRSFHALKMHDTCSKTHLSMHFEYCVRSILVHFIRHLCPFGFSLCRPMCSFRRTQWAFFFVSNDRESKTICELFRLMCHRVQQTESTKRNRAVPFGVYVFNLSSRVMKIAIQHL